MIHGQRSELQYYSLHLNELLNWGKKDAWAKHSCLDIINKTFVRVQSVPFQHKCIPQVQQNQHPRLDNPISIDPVPFKRS